MMRFGFAIGTVIACGISYKKWMKRETHPSKVTLFVRL